MRCRTIIKFRNSDDPNDLGFGRGIVQLLEGVEELGSINRATASMGMAYSKAWKIINSIEKEFDVRLIDREGAHGSHLTDEARALIRQYHEALDAADAAAMLRALSGRRHTVHTGLTVIRGGEAQTVVSAAAVYFRPMTEREIEWYVATGEPLDKAGAYGIQERGGIFVERIEGDFFTVLGLPLCELFRILGTEIL